MAYNYQRSTTQKITRCWSAKSLKTTLALTNRTLGNCTKQNFIYAHTEPYHQQIWSAFCYWKDQVTRTSNGRLEPYLDGSYTESIQISSKWRRFQTLVRFFFSFRESLLTRRLKQDASNGCGELGYALFTPLVLYWIIQMWLRHSYRWRWRETGPLMAGWLSTPSWTHQSKVILHLLPQTVGRSTTQPSSNANRRRIGPSWRSWWKPSANVNNFRRPRSCTRFVCWKKLTKQLRKSKQQLVCSVEEAIQPVYPVPDCSYS